MKTIVCDTGPLVALSLLQILEVVPKLFNPVVPAQVYSEWLDGDSKRMLPDSFRVADFGPPDALLTAVLDRGEASVIHAALGLSTQMVLIDEKKGRSIARRVYGLTTIGTARLLVEAKRAGHIGNIRPMFAELREQSYWIAGNIVEWACSEVGE